MKTLVLAASLLIAGPVLAQPVAIINGTIHTVGPAGVIENGTVIMDSGVIIAVGAGLPAPAAATVIDAKGAPVTPGLMNSNTRLGLVEVELEESTNDARTETEKFSAAFDISLGLNPESATIPVTRVRGVTRAVTVPEPGTTLFAGQGAVIGLGTPGRFWVKPKAAMFAALGEGGAELTDGSRAAAWLFLRTALDDAVFFKNNRRAFDRAEARDTIVPMLDLAALQPVIDGVIPLAMEVHRASDIREAIRLAADYRLRVILLGATEAWKVAAELAQSGLPVILDPRDNLPSRFETLNATLENVPKLVQAGVKVAFATGGDKLYHNPRNLTQFAGIAVANGITPEQALVAMTRAPAEIWGIAESYGTLERGKDADVVIRSGDPLEIASIPTHVFIRGEAIDVGDTRPYRLRDRYRDLRNQEPPLGYR
jgi:imidazolonepropionase-like amidohydrolase